MRLPFTQINWRTGPSPLADPGAIKKGQEEGATLVTGGAEAPEGLAKGYYVRPTVFSNVTSDMTIAQEEIFGPVLSILSYDDVDDAVRIANDSIYGLSGGVWSSDSEKAKAVRPPHADRTSGHQRRRLQPPGALRRIQTIRQRSRTRPRRIPAN